MFMKARVLALTPNVSLAVISLERVSQKCAKGLRSRLVACISPSADVKHESDRAGRPMNLPVFSLFSKRCG